MSATVIIDDPLRGGSAPGAWATAIAHTPHLAAQDRIAQREPAPASLRAGEAGGDASPPECLASPEAIFA